MDHTTVTAFIQGCILLIVGLAAFLARNWFVDQKKTSEKLTNAIEKLTDFIDRVERVQALHGFKIEQLERDIATITSSGALGRRKQDHCLMEGCPYERTNPGLGGIRTGRSGDE